MAKKGAGQTPDNVMKALKKGAFEPLYFLAGAEAYYTDLITKYIEENALTEAEKSFNQTVLYGKETSLDYILKSAKRFPVMAQRQVIIVKEAQEISELSRPNGRKALLKYLEKPVKTSTLVLAYKHKKFDAKTKFAKELAEKAVLVSSEKLYDNQLPAWINDFFRQKGYTLKPDAVAILADSIGNDLSRLSNEVDKMLLNLPDKSKPVTAGDIAEFIGISRDYNTFELQKALGMKDVVKSHRIINYFAADPKNHPIIPIIATLFSYFSKLLVLHRERGKAGGRLDKYEAAKILGVSPFFVQEYNQAAANYPPAKCINAIRYIKQADLHSKGINSTTASDQILKELVIKVLHF